jgi:hypothetical protein
MDEREAVKRLSEEELQDEERAGKDALETLTACMEEAERIVARLRQKRGSVRIRLALIQSERQKRNVTGVWVTADGSPAHESTSAV